MKQLTLTNEQTGVFALALGHMLHAGIGIADGLVLLGQDEKDTVRHQMLLDMADRVDGGEPLSAALKQAGCFPGYVCTLIGVGERVGGLEETLMALADYYDTRGRLERQLRNTLVYPAVLLSVLLGVLAVLLIWVLPVFDQVYARLGSHLTGVAGGLMAFGSALGQCLPVLLGIFAAAGICCLVPSVRRKVSAFFQRYLGDHGVFRVQNEARFFQVLTLCIRSGMTEREAAALAECASPAPGFKSRCGHCLENLEAGERLSAALGRSGLLNPSRCRLLEAGERAGRMDAVMGRISRQLMEESEAALVRLTAKVEPAMVTVACVLIGVVLLSVMLPLMHIMAAIG